MIQVDGLLPRNIIFTESCFNAFMFKYTYAYVCKFEYKFQRHLANKYVPRMKHVQPIYCTYNRWELRHGKNMTDK